MGNSEQLWFSSGLYMIGYKVFLDWLLWFKFDISLEQCMEKMIMAQKCSVIFGWMIMNKQDIDICTLLWNLRKMKFWTLELVFASPFYLVLLLHTERKIFFFNLDFILCYCIIHSFTRHATFEDWDILWHVALVFIQSAIVHRFFWYVSTKVKQERKLTFKKRHKKNPKFSQPFTF